MASPPKPWERQGAGPGASAPTISAATANTATGPATTASTTTTSSSTTPAIPARPASLTASVNQNAAAYSRPYGATPYGGMGGYGTAYSSPYTSPYSRLGGYGGYGGGMGGMYGSYGGYGGMYGGGMYGGMPGAMPGPNDPNNPESLTQRFGMSTQATFQMLEGIVGAFGGFAQMLESTYMATHSSFFAMVSVAEQFSNLRETLGSVLGIFTLMRWIRTLIAKITGRPPPVDATALTPAAFARFEGRRSPVPEGGPPKPSRKPLLFFLLAAFGLPYVMSKMIRSMAANVEEEERRRQLVAAQQMLDPSKLEFCRVLYDFSPAAQGQGAAVHGVDLEVRKGDLVAVLSKCDPLGNPSEWWKCRARDGGIGYLPSTFLEVLRKPGQPVAAIKGIPESESSRAHTMTSTTASEPSPVLLAANKPPAMPSTKVGDVTVESFQKSQFYS